MKKNETDMSLWDCTLFSQNIVTFITLTLNLPLKPIELDRNKM